MDTSKWISKFQRISWEPEILISGGILFTLFQAQSVLVQVMNYIYPLATPGILQTLGLFAVGISALTIGFSLHLVTKAFWIALLALNSVFPKGINLDKLGYSELFIIKLSIDPSLNSIVAKAGNTSSLMFVVAFLSLLVFFGLGVYMILMTLIFYVLPLEQIPFFIPFWIVFIPFIIPLIDFITFGQLKKWTFTSMIYYPYYKFISWLTLSFLYRDILYTINSNIPKGRIVLFSLLFIIPTSIWDTAILQILQVDLQHSTGGTSLLKQILARM